MTDETTEPIPPTQETLTLADVMKALDRITEKLEAHDIQFEAIRSGIVANSSAFDRLQAKVLNLSADVKELTEEVHQSRKTLA
jgi:peptidoglycan hydrolase CwlO-like protein